MAEIDITVHKHNEVYVKIQCEKGLAKEISEYFTFYVPGYKFVPAYRNRVWDGKIRLFNLQNFQLYFGLIPYLKEFCEERDYVLELNNIDIEDSFSKYHATKFFNTLNLHSKNKPISVNEHQLDAFVQGMRHKRQLLLSPTASGKSLIIYLFVVPSLPSLII